MSVLELPVQVTAPFEKEIPKMKTNIKNNKIVILPYFLGEKTPIHDLSAKGTITGLNLNHNKYDLWIAVLESVSFGFMHHLEILKENKKNWIAKRNIAIIFLMWGLGLRVNEVLKLQISQFSNSNEHILILGKGKQQRVVPIFEELKKFIITKLI